MTTHRKTTPRRTTVPAIPEVARTPDAIDKTLRALKESAEVGLGRRGDPMDRFATLRDLKESGLAQVIVGPGGGTVIIGSGPGTGAPLPEQPGRPNYGEDDFTPPPKPVNVRARGMPPELSNPSNPDADPSLGLVMVTWDQPDYHNHYYAEVYRSAGDLLDLSGFDEAYAHGVDNGHGQPNTLNGVATFVGIAMGTIFVDSGLAPIPPVLGPGVDELDQALNPGAYWYWVRFVSRAMVPGPFSDPSQGRLSINPASVLDAMTRNVTNTALFRNLREWLGLGSPEALTHASILEYVQSEASDDRIESMWTVRMGHRAGGLVWTSGFGLGMETVNGEEGWTSLSSFIVNANQFAIMGPNTLGAGGIIQHWDGGGNTLVVRIPFGHGFFVAPDGEPRQRAVIAVPEGDIVVGDPPMTFSVPWQIAECRGLELEVTNVQPAGGNTSIITLTTAIDRRSPQNGDPIPSSDPPAWEPAFLSWYAGNVDPNLGVALLPGSNIPFIVDTARGVVGIRGSLIVDGLVRGTVGEFNELIANTAFVRQLQAEVVNANVVIGQRIIAGTPGRGALTGEEYSEVSNYVVEMNNPVASEFALRMWKPSNGHTVFSLNSGSTDPNKGGDLYIGGHLTVAGSGVISGGGTTSGGSGTAYIFSTGGAGADGWLYPLWIGPRNRYGQAGEGRLLRYNSGSQPLLGIRSDGTAVFNANVFLGNDALTLPTLAAGNQQGANITQATGGPRASSLVTTSTTNNYLRVRAKLDGTPSLVMVTVTGQLYRVNETGDGNRKRFRFRASLVGSQGGGGGTLIQEVEMDDYDPETWAYSLSGVVTVPAGDYYVRVDLTNVEPNNGNMSIVRGWNAVAMQVTANGALDGTQQDSQPYSPPAALPPAIPEGDQLPNPMHVEAIQFIPFGRFVNIYDDAGQSKCRPADNESGHPAHGFILESADMGEKVPVFTTGANDRLEGLLPGIEYFLGTNGSVVTTPPGAGSGYLLQPLGVATSDIALAVNIGEAVERKT